MFPRITGHTVPATALDFLLPRTLISRRLSYKTHQLASKIVKPEEKRPTISSSFEHNALASLEEPLCLLRSAIRSRDASGSAHLWNDLKARNGFVLLGPPAYVNLSLDIAERAKKAEAVPLSDEETESLTEIALSSAAHGHTLGLNELMLLAIKLSKPQDAIVLYGQYIARLRERGVLDHSDNQPGVDDDGDSESMPRLAPSPIRSDILVMAVVAHVHLSTFHAALAMYLDASVSISSATLSTLSPLFPPPIIETAHTYLRHFDTAATLSRPAALRKRIVDLTRSNRHAILQRLYSTAIEGLQGPYAWLALRPQGLSKTRIVLLPDFFWTSFLTSFLLGRRTAMAERVWDDMAKLGITPPISAWNALLDGYSKTSRIEDAIRTWDVMTAHGVKPDALSYRALISGLHKAKRHQEASFRLNEFKRESSCAEPPFDPSAILAVYNTAINQLLFASREEDALSVLRTLEAQGPRPDIVTYNTLLRYYGRKGNLREMAKILAKLGTDSVQADIYTFSTVLSAMLKVRPDADKLMINFMKKQGITPDTTILTSIISHQLREHDLKNALDLLSRMENKEYPGVEPNDITYTAVLSGLNSENWLDSRVADEESRRIWDRMQKRNLQPNPATYNILLQAALASPDPQGLSNALTYYQDMKSRRAYMGNDMWYLLLRGLVRRKEFGLAREVVDDLARHTGAEYGLPSALQELVRTVRAGV